MEPCRAAEISGLAVSTDWSQFSGQELCRMRLPRQRLPQTLSRSAEALSAQPKCLLLTPRTAFPGIRSQLRNRRASRVNRNRSSWWSERYQHCIPIPNKLAASQSSVSVSEAQRRRKKRSAEAKNEQITELSAQRTNLGCWKLNVYEHCIPISAISQRRRVAC